MRHPTQVFTQVAATCESVWPGVNDSNLLVITDSVVRVETSVSFPKEMGDKLCLDNKGIVHFPHRIRSCEISSLVVFELRATISNYPSVGRQNGKR